MLLAINALICPVSAADLNIESISVSTSPSEINAGDDFNVEITFEGPDDTASVDVRIAILIDGVVVHNKTKSISFDEDNDTAINISSSSFEASGDDVWSDNLMSHDCGDHDIEVIVSGDINTEKDSDELSIVPDGDEDEKTIEFSISPSKPMVDDDITITVEDGNGDPLKSAKVRFTWIDDNEEGKWESDDVPVEEKTASEGDDDNEATFNIEDDLKGDFGEYQVDVYKTGGYCKSTSTISIVNGELTIGNPEPANPKAGEQFKIKVTDGTNPLKGVKGLINELGVKITSTSGDDGYLKFTIPKAGTYTIFINASGYGDDEKSVTVADLSGLSISISPASSEVSKPVTIAVFSGTTAISGASVVVTKPQGGKNTITTKSDGSVSYTPDQVGIYGVSASKDGYQNSSESFTVNSAFDVQSSPDANSLVYGSDLAITVLDFVTKAPVSSALISGTGVAAGSRTDSMGQFTTRLASSGAYNFVISKDGYASYTLSVTALCRVNIRMNATTSVEVGQGIGVKVFDKEKNDYTTGNVLITKPDGTTEAKTEEEFLFTPDAVGTYTLKLSKANCLGEEISLEAKLHPLRLESELKDGKIVIRAVSGGKPVSGVELNVLSPSGSAASVSSDANGLITLNAVEVGNYTISVADARYSGESITVQRESSFLSKYWWVILVVIIVMLIILLLVLIIVLLMRSRGSQDTSFKRVGRSKLN